MKWRGLTLVLAMAIGAGAAHAEPIRTLLSKENRFPDVRELELGVLGTFAEYTDNKEQNLQIDANQYVLTPQLRYMAGKDFALLAKLPVGYYDPDNSGSETGLGNLGLGFELRAYERFARYPYIIPHVMVELPTANEDVRIDRDEFGTKVGLSAGSKAWRTWTWILDISYEFFEKSENVARLGGSVIWDLSEDFAMLFEAGVSDEDARTTSDTDYPAIFLGGLSYEVNDRSSWQLYGGGESGTALEVFATLRYNYTF